MKKSLFPFIVLCIAVVGIVFFLQNLKDKIQQDFTKGLPHIVVPESTPGPSVSPDAVSESLFVPYWSLKSASFDERYKKLYYFGLAATTEGIDTEEAGYQNIDVFTSASRDTQRVLVIRMLESSTSLAILKSAAARKLVIDQSLEIAKQKGFSGVVLDLELAALPFDSLVGQITSFAKDFAKSAKESDLEFAMTLYGDTFYRVRPFEVKSLAQVVPSFLIMAYDFHKPSGNPGPNFPLYGKEIYGYDFATMLDNFSQYIKPDALTIIYGMYGYDWEVDDKGVSKGTAVVKTLAQIRGTILGNCKVLSCSSRRDGVSGEMVLAYYDAKGTKHEVWFEDESSVKRKESVALKMGVSQFSFWAYSFF